MPHGSSDGSNQYHISRFIMLYGRFEYGRAWALSMTGNSRQHHRLYCSRLRCFALLHMARSVCTAPSARGRRDARLRGPRHYCAGGATLWEFGHSLACGLSGSFHLPVPNASVISRIAAAYLPSQTLPGCIKMFAIQTSRPHHLKCSSGICVDQL